MSKYTKNLYEILVDFIYYNGNYNDKNEVQRLGTETIIQMGYQYIFDFDYELFDETYKSEIEKLFISHYLVHEIGSEVYNLWKHRLITEWKLKLKYYNQLYESTLLTFKPLEDFNTTESHTRNATKDSTGNTNSTNDSTTSTNNKSVYSDTPQGLLSGKDYATNATLGDNAVTANATSTGTNNENSNIDETISINKFGNNVDKASLLQRYRNTFLNVDMMFIYDLNDLFMLIF